MVLLTLQPVGERTAGPDSWSKQDKAFLEGIVARLIDQLGSKIADPIHKAAAEVKRANDSWERFSKAVESFAQTASELAKPLPWIGGGLAGLLIGILFRRPIEKVKA